MVETASHQAPPPQVARPPPPPLGGSRGPIFPPNEQLHQLHYCIHSNPSWRQSWFSLLFLLGWLFLSCGFCCFALWLSALSFVLFYFPAKSLLKVKFFLRKGPLLFVMLSASSLFHVCLCVYDGVEKGFFFFNLISRCILFGVSVSQFWNHFLHPYPDSPFLTYWVQLLIYLNVSCY